MQVWTVAGRRMTVWVDPTRGPSELIRNAWPSMYFTDGLKPRERMMVSTPEGEIQLVGVAKGKRPAEPVLPPPPGRQVSRPPAPPTRHGGKGSADAGNFFNVKGGFSTYAFPKHTLRDYLGGGPDSFRAVVGERMSVAEWKANGYPGGPSTPTPLQLEQKERAQRQAAAFAAKDQADAEAYERRQYLMEGMSPEERRKFEDAEREESAINEAVRRRKGMNYPFLPI